MVALTIGSTQNVYLTLTEKQLLTDPNYLFVFTQRTTGTEYKFVKLNATDTSLFKDRYNKFSFVVNTLFPSAKRGLYVYNVYEQVSAVNTDPTGLNLLETGLMEILQTTEIFTEPDSSSSFIIPS